MFNIVFKTPRFKKESIAIATNTSAKTMAAAIRLRLFSVEGKDMTGGSRDVIRDPFKSERPASRGGGMGL